MNNYIFITTEGFTYQPGSEAIEPDCENCQVIGYGDGDAPESALKNMIKQNPYLQKMAFQEIIAYELSNCRETYHNLKFA